MSIRHPAPLKLSVELEQWPLKTPFRISDHTWVALDVVVVSLEQDGCIGRG